MGKGAGRRGRERHGGQSSRATTSALRPLACSYVPRARSRGSCPSTVGEGGGSRSRARRISTVILQPADKRQSEKTQLNSFRHWVEEIPHSNNAEKDVRLFPLSPSRPNPERTNPKRLYFPSILRRSGTSPRKDLFCGPEFQEQRPSFIQFAST